MHAPKLGKCANSDCHAQFKRLGTGRIYTLPVTEPRLWGLPSHIRQKVVWLCAQCARTKDLKFDQQHLPGAAR